MTPYEDPEPSPKLAPRVTRDSASAPDRAVRWFDNRLAISRGAKKWLDYIFPDHWSFMLGEIALYAFIVLLISGVFLTFYFVPSAHEVTYTGKYVPLVGQRMSEAYKSAVDLSFQVRGGLLMRQAHHWAANIFIGAIIVHMGRIFFTGAFRRPRELNWMVGATLLLLAIMNGYLGYSLPGDLLSGTGVRIGFSIVESIPFVGSYLAIFLFGGNYPGTLITERFYIAHVLIVPLLIMALLGAHLSMIIRAHHTQFPGPHRREDNVVGTPLWPAYLAKTTGLLALVAGVILALGAFGQINPIWRYGPYDPFKASDAAQPDWYVGWLEGAMRLFPSWEIHLPGHMVPEQFFPTIALPALTWGLIYAWPFLEAKLTGDHAEHHLLDFPRDRPIRTAIGCAVFAFYFVLFAAASDDVVANWFDISLNDLLVFYRYACLVAPALVFAVTWKVCHELAERPPSPNARKALVVELAIDGAYYASEQQPTTVPAKPPPARVG